MSSASLEHIRHTLAHLLAHAVQDAWPNTKFAIGPAIDHGFYYDLDPGRNLTPDDLKNLEKRVRHLIKQRLPMKLVGIETPGVADFIEAQPFKQELLEEIKAKGETPTFYQIGKFIDLCRGGHVDHAGQIDPNAFTLSHVAGAYWRGDNSKPMLQRIYGVAFPTKDEFNLYQLQQAEAAQRDHRKIGRELDLFSFQDIAPGSPFWHPNGMIIIRQLEMLWREIHDRAEYLETSTPIMNQAELYKKSGHWEHFRGDMFTLKIDEQDYALKPMNCPSSTRIYSSRQRSYRDLPIRLSEIGRLHRNELRGALGGLFRVRQITMDDAHIYCRSDQIEQEVKGVLTIVKTFYQLFRLRPTFKLATMPDQHLGEVATWKSAETSLKKVLQAVRLPYELKLKDGAFYGPKIDIHVDDALGRTHQVATIQLDFQMPERFELEYTDQRGKPVRPVMIHRAIFGSFERFLGILIEHTAGAFPLWLSPTQIQVIPVSTKHNIVGKKLRKQLNAAGLRVHLDDSNESVGYKIRKAEKMKVPYMIVVGDKEKALTKLSIRVRDKTGVKKTTLKAFLSASQKLVSARSVQL